MKFTKKQKTNLKRKAKDRAARRRKAKVSTRNY
jgi:hypothetical protein